MSQWSNESGLRSNNLTSIFQSSDSYIWITPFNGIHQFDGVSFKMYDKNNIPQLINSSVFSIHENKNGAFWFSTEASGDIGYKQNTFFSLDKKDSLPNLNYS